MDYKTAGVNIEQANSFLKTIGVLARKTHNNRVLNDIGSFSGFYELPKYENPVLSATTDGVGTKIKLACLLNEHWHIGQDLVAMCSNDLITSGARPLFFLDYYSVGKLNPLRDNTVLKSIIISCELINCSLIGGETAEMPDLYNEYEYDLAGFMVGIQNKNTIIDGSKIKKNDIVIGIESSGVHSNGFSLIRKVLPIDVLQTRGIELLTPTHLYNKVVLNLTTLYSEINGMAHITGGGLYNNIKRILPDGLDVDINYSWDIPLIFGLIMSYGINIEEMRNVFNMGIGYTIIVNPIWKEHVLRIINSCNLKGYVIGEVF